MVPILTGGALEAQIDISSAQFQEAMANYGSVALKAFSEFEHGIDDETLLRGTRGASRSRPRGVYRGVTRC